MPANRDAGAENSDREPRGPNAETVAPAGWPRGRFRPTHRSSARRLPAAARHRTGPSAMPRAGGAVPGAGHERLDDAGEAGDDRGPLTGGQRAVGVDAVGDRRLDRVLQSGYEIG